jgi:hypothetical protein
MQNKAENVKEQKPDRIFVNEMFVEQSSSMAAATDPGRMRIMSREGSESRSRMSKHMPSDQVRLFSIIPWIHHIVLLTKRVCWEKFDTNSETLQQQNFQETLISWQSQVSFG